MTPKKKNPIASTQRKKKQAKHDDKGSSFISVEAQLSWSYCQKLGVITGRNVMWSDFGKWKLLDLFEKVGLLDFCSTCTVTYPQLVRMFYANMELSSDEKKIQSLVKGKKNILTVEAICDIFKLPNTDDKHFFWPKGDYSDIIPKETVTATICNEKYHGQKLKHQKYLNDCARFINRIVSHNIVPRAGHYETVQPLQALMNYAIMVGWKLNVGHIIFNFMLNSEKRGGSLPYGMALTLIFMHFGVVLDGECKQKKPKPLDRGTVTKMIEICNDRKTKKGKGKKRATQVIDEDGEESGEDRGGEEMQALGRDFHSKVNLYDLHQSIIRANKHLDKIDQRFENIDTRFATIEKYEKRFDDIDKGFIKVEESFQSIKGLLKKHLPSSPSSSSHV